MASNNAAGQERRGTTHRLMKRHERSSAGLLLLMIFTTSLLLQVSAQSSEETSKGQATTRTVEDQAKKKRSGLRPVLLLARPENDAASVDPVHVVVWNQQRRSKIKLDKNGTEVLIPKKGYYLINLRMSYRVPEQKCPCVDDNVESNLCYLYVSVMWFHEAYPQWRPAVEGKETMTCNEGSRQVINLVKVTFLSEDETKMKVIVDSKNLQLISWTSDNYFEIIHLK